MLTVQLFYILPLLSFFLLAWIILIIININHLLRTGTFDFISFFVTVILIIFSVAALLTALYLLRDINWQENITVWNSSWVTAAFNP